MFEDLKQRIPFYLSDFYDGFVGEKTLHKTISATIFLYFACILPAIAFGVLNLHNTHGKIGVMDAIMGQTMGGILFSMLAGQPLIVIMTTAPIALYIKIIVAVAEVTPFIGFFLSLFASRLLSIMRLFQIVAFSGARYGLLCSVHECRPVERRLRDNVRNNQCNQADEVLHQVYGGDLRVVHLHRLHGGRLQRCLQ